MPQTVTVINSHEEVTYALASFGERFVARIIDTLIIFIPNAIIPILVAWLYWALQQSGNSQATVGQKVMKLKVIDKNGEKINFGQASGRFFANILNLFTFFLGYFMLFFNDKNQCLHDFLSGCIVVRAEALERVDDDITKHLVE